MLKTSLDRWIVGVGLVCALLVGSAQLRWPMVARNDEDSITLLLYVASTPRFYDVRVRWRSSSGTVDDEAVIHGAWHKQVTIRRAEQLTLSVTREAFGDLMCMIDEIRMDEPPRSVDRSDLRDDTGTIRCYYNRGD
jgi:hypothetical protein